MAEINAWLEAHRLGLNILYNVVQVSAAAVFAWCAQHLMRCTWEQAAAITTVFAEARETLLNATAHGLEERLAALEKIVMEDHLQRIERAPGPPESEGR